MKANNNSPAIRFAGFTNAWEQHQLGELAEISSGVMGDALLTEGKYRLTRIETISDGYVDESHVGYTNSKPSADYLLRNGDILYSNINSISHIGKVAQFHSKLELFHGINLLRIRPNCNVNSDFLLSIFRTEKSQNWAKSHANQAVSQASINQTLLGTQQLSICDQIEQRKIGSFISDLDNLITLHQRKYEKLVNLKKAMLDKMFPKNGELVPEVRFAGFSGNWERRKLGVLADITTGKLDANAMTPDGKYDFYTCSLQVYKINKYAFEGPAITIAGNGYVGCLHLADGKFNAYQRTYVLSNFKAAREYLYAEIGNKLPSKVNQEARNGNIPYIVMEMLTDLEVSLPSAEEQCKLGNLFAALDRLITFHQRKYERLVNLKSAFLEKMFV